VALRTTQSSVSIYGALLVQLASQNRSGHSLLTAGVADDFDLLKRRIMQFRNKFRASKRTRLLGAFALVMGICGLLPLRLVAQNQTNSNVTGTPDTYAGDTFAAHVVDEKGAPVTNAKIYFIKGGGLVGTASTDVQGAFVLKNAALTFEPDYDIKMIVVDGGLQGMAKRWVGRPGKVQPLVLEAPYSASFRFVDPNGEPVKNIDVTLPQQAGFTKDENGPWVWLPPSILERYKGKTNDEGIATFQGLPQYNLPKYANLTGGTDGLSTEDLENVKKTGIGRVSTITTNRNGRKTTTPLKTWLEDLTPTKGVIRYAPLVAEYYSKPNSPTTTRTIRTSNPQRVKHEYVPEPVPVMGAAASGKVLNPDGSAATDAKLYLIGTTISTDTDGEGKFQFASAPKGMYVIGVARKSTPTSFIASLETTDHNDLVIQIKASRRATTPPRLDPDH
jgi:hypothetical protein